MQNQQIPTVSIPASGQLCKYVEEFDFMNSEIPFTVLDVTDNIVYFTPNKMYFKDGVFFNQITIHHHYGKTYFLNEPFTFKKGIPSKIILESLDLFQKDFEIIPEEPAFIGVVKSIVARLKSKMFS